MQVKISDSIKYIGVDDKTIDEVNYVPSEVFSRMNLSTGDIMSIIRKRFPKMIIKDFWFYNSIFIKNILAPVM